MSMCGMSRRIGIKHDPLVLSLAGLGLGPDLDLSKALAGSLVRGPAGGLWCRWAALPSGPLALALAMLGDPPPQLTFADLQGRHRVPLQEILRQIRDSLDWEPIEKQLRGLYPSGRGRPSHRPLVLFRALLLRRWFKLSDPALEAGLRDRLSWQYFCGLSLLEPIPDETTFCRFRSRLARAGLGESLFHQVEIEMAQFELPFPSCH